jgi:hypothetical protein
MTKRRKPLQPCVWCRAVRDKYGDRPCLTYDFTGGRYHARCFIAMVLADSASLTESVAIKGRPGKEAEGPPRPDTVN